MTAWRERQVLHLDVADFPVAVERVVDPALRGRPVVVAPPAVRATVLAASPEAREEGVRVGMRLDEARRRCRGLRVAEPNPPLYRRAFTAIQELAGRFSPVVEPGPPGRIYLDATGTERLFGPGVDLAARIRRELQAGLRLDAALGVAVNKSVSRVAADVTEPAGLREVDPGTEADFLAPLPVVRLPGAGREVLRELRELNVRRIGQVARMSPEPLCLAFGRYGLVLHQRARGIDPRPVRSPRREPGVHRAQVLPEDTNDRALLRAWMRALVADAARELRLREHTASRLELEVHYADARCRRAVAALPRPSAQDFALARAAESALGRALDRRVRVRRLDLFLQGLAARPRQMELFPSPEEGREAALVRALDEIRRRYGAGALELGPLLCRLAPSRSSA